MIMKYVYVVAAVLSYGVAIRVDLIVAVKTNFKSGSHKDEHQALEFLQMYNERVEMLKHEAAIAAWNFESNITDETEAETIKVAMKEAQFDKDSWKKATAFAWKELPDSLVRRQFQFIVGRMGDTMVPAAKLLKVLESVGTSALRNAQNTKYSLLYYLFKCGNYDEFQLANLCDQLQSTYSTAKICEFSPTPNRKSKCNLSLEPDLARIMSQSRNYDELSYVWKAWRDAAGKPSRGSYMEAVRLKNEGAKLAGYNDAGEIWLESYEDENILDEWEQLWQEVLPLYEQLHAYVRRKLIQKYGADKIKPDGPIPAHLLGDMWGQTWNGIFDLAIPYPKKLVNITSSMLAQNYTALRIFKLAEEFFVSLDLEPMTPGFWNKSIIEKPLDGRELVCHPSAWDFFDKNDFRIKQCTQIDENFLITTHHEMGHIQYYELYKNQPILFRDGANEGFHEAVGDLMALSVSTTSHLQKIGLVDNATSNDEEMDLNFLMDMALRKVAFLPFGYLIDKWRLGVFSGNISENELNKKWWDYRLKYQGMSPPVPRSEEDFDPAAKFHVSAFIEYSRYFVARILQFQFHKSLCNMSGHTGPLFKCDIYKSKEAGNRLRSGLKLGSSTSWPQILAILTGGSTDRMSSIPLLDYFHPLYEWLKIANKDEHIGWME